MNGHASRRSFLKTAGALGAGIGLGRPGRLHAAGGRGNQRAPNAEKLGWRLGCGSWTFHVYTLFEAIDKTAALGLKYFETGPHPKLSREQPNVAFDEDAPASVRQAVKQKLADSGLKLVSYGMISYTKDLTRKTFDFAKDMGAEMILSEPRGSSSTCWISCAKNTI